MIDQEKSKTKELKTKIKKASDLVLSIEKRHQKLVSNEARLFTEEQNQTAEIKELKELIEQFNREDGEEFLRITHKDELIATSNTSISGKKKSKDVTKMKVLHKDEVSSIRKVKVLSVEELTKPDFSNMPKFDYSVFDFMNTPPPPKENIIQKPITLSDLIKFMDDWNGNEYGKIMWLKGTELLEEIFMELTKQKGIIGPILTEMEVKELLRNNFSCYPDKPTGRIFSANIKRKYTLEGFIYQVFDKYGLNRNQKNDYAQLLIKNFHRWQGADLTSVKTSMSRSLQEKNKNSLYILLLPEIVVPTSSY